MVRRLVLAALALIAVGVMSTAQAQKGDKWVLMGTREVDLAKSNDSIDVSKAKGRIKAVRLEAKDGAILLSRVQVVYHNGVVHNEDRRINLLEDERTRPIDLRNDERFADAVNIVFERRTDVKDKTSLEVWGLQSPGGATAQRSVPSVAGPGSVSPPSAGSAAAPASAIAGPATYASN